MDGLIAADQGCGITVQIQYELEYIYHYSLVNYSSFNSGRVDWEKDEPLLLNHIVLNLKYLQFIKFVVVLATEPLVYQCYE